MAGQFTEAVNVWERQRGETPKAFEAFCLYRDAGAQRSLQSVADALHKSKTMIARWSGRYSWVERTIAFDRWADAEAQRQVERDAREAKRSRIIAARWMQSEGLRQLRAIAARGESIPAAVAVRMVETGANSERLEYGEATSRGEVDVPTDGSRAARIAALLAAIQSGVPDVVETAVEAPGAIETTGEEIETGDDGQ